MKKVLIFGSVVMELRNYVNELPKGNENFDVLKSEEDISGSGFICSYNFKNFGFPYTCVSNIGGGLYGDYIIDKLNKYNVEINYSQNGIAGCLYSLYDKNGNEIPIMAQGNEYDFFARNVEEIDIDEYSSIIVFGDSLIGDNSEELVDFLSRCEIPIYFMTNKCCTIIDEDIMSALFDMSDIVFLNEKDAYYLTDEKFDELSICSDHLQSISNNKIVIFVNNKGLYVNDGEETYIANGDPSIDELNCACSLFIALNTKVDLKNSCMFAVDFAKNLNGKVKDINDFSNERRKLAGIILH